ncbi:symmetrical bis(5'-nucleosyl)-tetraphosphatase [Gammaproteobacteria bacterium]|jgi:bis(5'-nucleosyl)-tetraphosphatase (symmetrical)|nr:symmetrical bis(5'-nucleosyl)-tetraphosphatase [Gammaproteobacteria bacterium]MDA9049049.1 symmetrical bis(5'-nucleosyl)-tetraphosphatase [Gammaproteobacteria bacterium]MDA9154129.1 symmetrical bis(5'-nucleosyl)-tetraphosphatase [Gammaproteobacteria bacterium]MDA9341294.1 symmetrical bis(5'-nucleosyl)-tetraphosphatase [Gammaproteobacteria bacterium]MDA9365230.1 symmetrical bis(5'-nucleosyl)-tetraphosphatase [Gammaproteobacteria bacterium]|tara:strand:- start:13629 stop:14432 length:804 start_codon:yes stop_codon:yes gene_type:complete
MSTYAVGDVHGCYSQFLRLLDKIDYSPSMDKIILTGDLVNRGNESLAMINFCMNNPEIKTVLGNHDLYLLYLLSINKGKGKLKQIVNAKNNKKIYKWLLGRPLFLKEKDFISGNTFFITHAGIPEIWSPSKAGKLAKEASNALKQNPKKFLESMWGDHPRTWNESLAGSDRNRMIVNYLTRMRFINQAATLDLKNASADSSDNFRPWFKYSNKSYQDKQYYYIFGHWAALNGRTQNKHFIGLDTGCVWKEKLTALRLEDLRKFSVKY